MQNTSEFYCAYCGEPNLTFIDFIKYALSFDGIIFGPWISFGDFLRSMNQRKKYIVIFYNSKIYSRVIKLYHIFETTLFGSRGFCDQSGHGQPDQLVL